MHLILADIVEPKPPKGAKNIICRKADLTDVKEIEALYSTEFGVPDTVYCFHGIMSRGSEDNFDLGLKVSLVFSMSQAFGILELKCQGQHRLDPLHA